jgi:uncharacterized protein
MKMNNYVVKANSTNGDNFILFNYLNCKSITYPKVLFPTEESLFDEPNIFKLLNSQNFLDNFENYPNTKDIDDKTLNLTLLVHENCNFRCTYCYEKFEKNAMETDVIENVIKFVKKTISNSTNKYEHIHFSWFGGEPLLNIKAIELICFEIIPFAEKLGIDVVGDITTNGFLLTKSMFKRLTSVNVKCFQITIDGIKDYHDKQRVLKNGKGTYERILNNLRIISSETEDDVNFILRTNVGKDNYSSMDTHIRQLTAEFSKDKRIYFSFHNIGNWGEREVAMLKKGISFEMSKKVISAGGRSAPVLWMLLNSPICYAANKDSHVIGTDGLIYKCTVALYNEKNIVGALTENGTLDIDKEKEKIWTTDSTKVECHSCSVLPACYNNRCPLQRIDNNKELHCPTFKFNTTELLQMIELQNCISYSIAGEVNV